MAVQMDYISQSAQRPYARGIPEAWIYAGLETFTHIFRTPPFLKGRAKSANFSLDFRPFSRL